MSSSISKVSSLSTMGLELLSQSWVYTNDSMAIMGVKELQNGSNILLIVQKAHFEATEVTGIANTSLAIVESAR